MNLPAHRAMLSAAAAASVLLLTAACGSSEKADVDTSAPAATSAAPSQETAGAPAESGSYADGDYSGDGSYINPGGSTSSVEVDLTLQGGIVTAVQVEPQASGASLQYQKKFVSGVADEVVGKSIDELSVSKVAGSSLTSQGFNAAIEQIKAEARA